jgi:hypothetical protein
MHAMEISEYKKMVLGDINRDVINMVFKLLKIETDL